MPDSLSRARLDSFSDGVMAVIITIMVLELKVPPVHEMSNRAALLSNARIFAVYLLSFIQVGIYWVNHYYLLDDLETVTHAILWANLALLFTLSLIPFGVEWIGSRGIAPVPVAIYAVCFLLPSITWTILAGLIGGRTHVAPAASLGKQIFSSALTVAAIGIAFVSPVSALGMVAVAAVVWLIPPRSIRNKTRPPTGDGPRAAPSPWIRRKLNKE